jgi:hypothetical protein
MEINLQGYKLYNKPDWDGKVELSRLKIYQYKRIANAGDSVSLFRKLLKIFKSPDSPVMLPAGLEPKDLCLNDFFQIIIGISALHERSIQRTFICKHCKVLNPRGIDILKVFNFEPPKIAEGVKNITIPERTNNKGVDASKTQKNKVFTLKYSTIAQYIQLNEYINGLYAVNKEADYMGRVVPELKIKFGDIFEFNDYEDATDFKELLEDFGMIAAAAEMDGMDFVAMVKWLFKFQDADIFKAINEATVDLAPTMDTTYKTKCTNCEREIAVNLNPSDYFFVTP